MKTKLFLITLFFSTFIFSQNKNETIASNWIQNHQKELNIKSQYEFKKLFSHKGPSGETLRYYQFLNDVPVFDASIAIHINNNGKVTFYSSTYDSSVSNIDTNPSITSTAALNKAIKNLNLKGNIYHKESKLYLYNKLNDTKLVYRVVTMSELKSGAWETIIDAHNGSILSTKDIALYYHNGDKDKKKKKNAKNTATVVDGTGMVFNTDPLTATLNTYGGQYSDNNDATNNSLDNARESVTLKDIQLLNGTYTLKGPYCEIASLGAPNTGLFQQNSSVFNFNRNQQGFEAVNCYYHIDKSIRYINETLGINLVSLYNGGVLRYDPHAEDGADNSHYTAGTLNFGEGGVDDAEDADVILHELGHGLHDWVTNGQLSQVNGLSEGSGDYWANSYKRSLGQWNSNNASYYYVFGWDGHNQYWGGRTTNYNAQYPSGLVGQIHADGQIWASVMMEIWEIVGRQKTDKAFLEGLGMTNSNTNQQNAAIAVRQAAIDMNYTCTEINAFTDRFEARGYNLPVYNCDPAAIDDNNINQINIYPNPANDLVNIELSNTSENFNFRIFNALGQEILKGNLSNTNNQINVSNIENGVYFIRIEDPNNHKNIVKTIVIE